MARKKKEDETEQETEQTKPSEVKAMISPAKLKRLMAAKRSTSKDTQELAGQLGIQIKNAIENDHLDRKMFGWITQLDKMENEKIADHLAIFEYYLDISGINKRAGSVMKMNLKENDGDEEEADDEDSNVSPFPAAAGNA